MPAFRSFYVNKTARKRLEAFAGKRLKTVTITRIIPDYVQERIVEDTGRLRQSVRAGDNDRYYDGPNNSGIEVPILIGGTTEKSLRDSQYDNYGDKGAGTERDVNYVGGVKAIRGSLSNVFGEELFDDLPNFVATEM